MSIAAAALDELWPSTSLDAWRQNPQRTFEDWIAHRYVATIPGRAQQFRDTSVRTYATMFKVWCDFLAARLMHTLEATQAEAQAFFEHQDLTAVSRRRYLQLLDRVYQHLRKIGLVQANPMADELSKERALTVALPTGLDDFTQDQLRDHLDGLEGWKGARDRAMAALLLGAGLRTNEAVDLRISAVASDFSIRLMPSGVHKPHTTLMTPEGPWRAWWSQWALERNAAAPGGVMPGDVACPATLKGKAYSPSGLFRRVSQWFEDCALEPEQRGANILRNTFARNVLLSGRYELYQVQEFLGHAQARATQRHALSLPEDIKAAYLDS